MSSSSASDVAETSRRRDSMADANAILAISGGSLSPEVERLAAAVVAGEMTDEDAIAELLRPHS